MLLQLELDEAKSQHKPDAMIDIGNLHAFPLISSGKQGTSRISSTIEGSSLSSSVASEMIERFDKLEEKLLSRFPIHIMTEEFGQLQVQSKQSASPVKTEESLPIEDSATKDKLDEEEWQLPKNKKKRNPKVEP